MNFQNAPSHNWKYGVGFALGILVTLVVIIVLANTYGKSTGAGATQPPPEDSTQSATRPPAGNLAAALPRSEEPSPPEGAEAYEPAPF